MIGRRCSGSTGPPREEAGSHVPTIASGNLQFLPGATCEVFPFLLSQLKRSSEGAQGERGRGERRSSRTLGSADVAQIARGGCKVVESAWVSLTAYGRGPSLQRKHTPHANTTTRQRHGTRTCGSHGGRAVTKRRGMW